MAIPANQDRLTIKSLQRLKLDFPTLLPVHDMIQSGSVQMFTLNVMDSRRRTEDGFYRIVVHCPNASSQMPMAYVINKMTVARHPHAYSKGKVPGTNSSSIMVCLGPYQGTYLANPGDVSSKLSGFINHIISVLNS